MWRGAGGRTPESADDDVPADRAEREDGREGNSEAHADVPLGRRTRRLRPISVAAPRTWLA
jgi:hypothetical protein